MRVAVLCCKSLTNDANIKFQPNACSSRFKQFSPFLLGGKPENIHNYFINQLPVLIILINPLPVLIALKILLFTRSFMINTRPLVGCLENSDRKVKRFRVILRIASLTSSCLLFVDTMCLVLQRDSRFLSRNCHTTDVALTERLGLKSF